MNEVCVYCGDRLITGLNGDVCLDCLRCEQEEQERALWAGQSALYELKHDLANSLQALKKFDTGYKGSVNDAIVVEHNGQVFVLRFELSPLTLEGAVDEL